MSAMRLLVAGGVLVCLVGLRVSPGYLGAAMGATVVLVARPAWRPDTDTVAWLVALVAWGGAGALAVGPVSGWLLSRSYTELSRPRVTLDEYDRFGTHVAPHDAGADRVAVDFECCVLVQASPVPGAALELDRNGLVTNTHWINPTIPAHFHGDYRMLLWTRGDWRRVRREVSAMETMFAFTLPRSRQPLSLAIRRPGAGVTFADWVLAWQWSLFRGAALLVAGCVALHRVLRGRRASS